MRRTCVGGSFELNLEVLRDLIRLVKMFGVKHLEDHVVLGPLFTSLLWPEVSSLGAANQLREHHGDPGHLSGVRALKPL